MSKTIQTNSAPVAAAPASEPVKPSTVVEIAPSAAVVPGPLTQKNAVSPPPPEPPPVPAVKLTQQNAATSEKSAVLQACIDACSKWGNTVAKAAADFCRTALGAIGQANESEELYEAGYAAMAAAKESGEEDSTEAIAAAHTCLKVVAIVEDEFPCCMYSVKDKSIFVPRAQRKEIAVEPKKDEAKPMITQVNAVPAVTAEVQPKVAAVEAQPATTIEPAKQPTQLNAADPITQLNAVKSENEALKAKEQQNAAALVELQRKLDAMAGGAPPVPSAGAKVGSQQYKTWGEALDATKKANPDMADHQAYALAKRLYPKLIEQLNSQPIARQ